MAGKVTLKTMRIRSRRRVSTVSCVRGRDRVRKASLDRWCDGREPALPFSLSLAFTVCSMPGCRNSPTSDVTRRRPRKAAASVTGEGGEEV